MMEEYDKYPSKKKIEIQLAKRSVFIVELNGTEEITTLELSTLEKKVLQYQQNFLRKKIWSCEDEINILYNNLTSDDPCRDEIYKKIKTSNVNEWPYGVPEIDTKMTYDEYYSLSPVDKIKAMIMYCKIFYLEFEKIKNRKKESLSSQKTDEYKQIYLKLRRDRDGWYILQKNEGTYERKDIDKDEFCQLYREELPDDYLILEYRSKALKNAITSFRTKMGQIYHEEIPEDYPFKKEILEEIELVDALELKVYKPKYVLPEYVQAGFVLDKAIDARKKSYSTDKLTSELDRIYTFMRINSRFETYSPKKKIEIAITFHYLFNMQINAVETWRMSRQMDKYEKTFADGIYNALQYKLSLCDRRILNIYYKEIKEDAPYKSDILKKIQSANICKQTYNSGIKPLLLDDFILKYTNEEQLQEDRIRYLIAFRSLTSAECDMIKKVNNPRKLYDYEKIIYDSTFAFKTMEVVKTDNLIHIVYNNLPEDYPYRKELIEKMESENVSDKGVDATEYMYLKERLN